MNKIYLFLVFSILTTIGMAQEKIKQTAGRDQLGTFAPKFAELNDDVLFGEVWSRTDRLGLRDRSLVTTALPEQRLQRLSRTSVFMRVGRKLGLRSGLPRKCGPKIRTVRMRKLLSNVR